MTQAFDGIRILDFTQVLAGPFAVMQLALLGAEVIKVEQPGAGDQTRGLMNESGDPAMSPSFMAVNLNKQSLTLNLKHAAAIDIVKRLVPTIDVLVENFKGGTMSRMGLDYETLRSIKPDLIYCSVTGYGQSGPRAGDAAYDGAIQAASGMMSQNGHESTGPTRTGYMPVDMSTALNTAFAIAAALHRKAVTGEGQQIDVAMMDTAIIMQAAQYSNYLNHGSLVGLRGNASPTRQPTANVFPTKDGYIQITALRQPQVEKMFAVMGIENLLELPAFADPSARIKHPDAVHDAMSEVLQTATTSEWMARLAPAGVPVAEINSLPDVINAGGFENRNTFVSLPSPLTPDEEITVAMAGYVTDADGPSVRAAPPLLGSDTDEILQALGFSAGEIDNLRESGVV